MEKLLTTKEAAQLLGLSKWFVQSRVKDGSLPVIRISRNRVRYRPADIERFVAKLVRK